MTRKIKYLIDWDRKITELARKHIKLLSKCQRCGYCCQNTRILVTIPEMIRILQYLGVNFDRVFFIEPEYYSVTIRTRTIGKMSHCMFWDGEKCTIYVVRPFQCFTYPVIFHVGYKDLATFEEIDFGFAYFKCQGRNKHKLRAKIDWLTLELLAYERFHFLVSNYKLQSKLVNRDTLKTVVELNAGR